MKLLTFAAIAGALAVSACAAQDEMAETADGAQVANQDEQMICRRDRETGSRFAERICMTQEEWEAQREASRELKDRYANQADRNREAPAGGLGN